MLIERVRPTRLSKDDQAKVQCELCGEQRLVRWHSVWKKENHHCRRCIPKIKLTGRKHTLERRINQSRSLQKSGGGWRIQEGYKQINVFEQGHSRKDQHIKGSYVMEHILVMEKHIGRYIEKHELVHHIDEDRLNNSIENLYLCSGVDLKESRQIHNKIHQSAEDLTIKLYRCGLVKFVNGEYVMSEELASLASRIL